MVSWNFNYNKITTLASLYSLYPELLTGNGIKIDVRVVKTLANGIQFLLRLPPHQRNKAHLKQFEPSDIQNPELLFNITNLVLTIKLFVTINTKTKVSPAVKNKTYRSR